MKACWGREMEILGGSLVFFHGKKVKKYGTLGKIASEILSLLK